MQLSAPDFDLALTLQSGQVFHWYEDENAWWGLIGEQPVRVRALPEALLVQGAEKEAVIHYFALDHPVRAIQATFPKDPAMQEALGFCRGMRILRQPAWECLATFITSAMKQVAHIRQMSGLLRRRFGFG